MTSALGSIWADGADNSQDRAGEAHIIFGAASLPQTIHLASASAGVTRIVGSQAGDEAGVSVFPLGDINGDQIDDFVVGARYADGLNAATTRSGESYIFYGRQNFAAVMDATADANVVIYGADVDDFSGWPVRGQGDVNGDGYNDILVVPRCSQILCRTHAATPEKRI
ncbi:MAG: integrin alpha [Planctomycetaceae bacterium]